MVFFNLGEQELIIELLVIFIKYIISLTKRGQKLLGLW